MFDLEVEGLHNFYVRGPGGDAAGVLVHNSSGGDEMVRVFTTTDGSADWGRARGTFVPQSVPTDPVAWRVTDSSSFRTRGGNLGFPDTVTEIEVPRSSLMPDATDTRAAAHYPEMGFIPVNAPGASVTGTHTVTASFEEVCPLSVTDREAAAREAFEAGDYRWTLAIFEGLGEDEALTVVANAYLGLFGEWGFTMDPAWLRALEDIASSNFAGRDWMKMSREVWYVPEGRRDEHAAISQLFGLAASRAEQGENVLGSLVFMVSGAFDYSVRGEALLTSLVEALGTLPTTSTRS